MTTTTTVLASPVAPPFGLSRRVRAAAGHGSPALLFGGLQPGRYSG